MFERMEGENSACYDNTHDYSYGYSSKTLLLRTHFKQVLSHGISVSTQKQVTISNEVC